MNCSECGAKIKGMRFCYNLFDEHVRLKYTGDGKSYPVMMACYTLQHPQSHSLKAWIFAKRKLKLLVEEQISSMKADEVVESSLDSADLEYAQKQIDALANHRWSMTIVDFAEHAFPDPLSTAREWGRKILAELPQPE